MTRLQDMPWQLRQYVEAQHRSEINSNQCDHRPTSQEKLDDITDEAEQCYKTGEQWQASLTPEIKRQCAAVYALRHQYGSHLLTQVKIDGRWMLVPCYFTIIEEVRKLAKIFTPETTPA